MAPDKAKSNKGLVRELLFDFRREESNMEPIQSAAGLTERQPEGFLAFMPATLPPELPEFDQDAVRSISEAGEALGRLSGMAHALPNRDLFVGMYVRKEAILSSKIEGIECTLEEVLEFEQEVGGSSRTSEKLKAVEEVVNYVRAVNYGFERVTAGAPIDLQLLRELHARLMPGTRGDDRPVGEFRKEQNWIGAKGSTAFNARYVPPPVDRMNMALANLAYYVNEFQGHAALIRCAVAHAQFETIHPFHDGNGRMGRLLVTLMLGQQGMLPAPLLYPSLFLLAHRQEYFDRLTFVRSKADWSGWITFFAAGMKHAAGDANLATVKISDLRAEVDKRTLGMPTNARSLAVRLFEMPLLGARAAQKILGSSFDTAADALKRLESHGLVKEISGKRRGKLYRFSAYLDILESAGEHEPAIGLGRFS